MTVHVELTAHFFEKVRERIANHSNDAIFEILTKDVKYEEGVFYKMESLIDKEIGLYLPSAGASIPLIELSGPKKLYRAVTVYRSLPPESLRIRGTKPVKIKWNYAEHLRENFQPLTSQTPKELSASFF
jgi:hypothetical protein